eukprot:746276-Hanusia_phi.AAC.2
MQSGCFGMRRGEAARRGEMGREEEIMQSNGDEEGEGGRKGIRKRRTQRKADTRASILLVVYAAKPSIKESQYELDEDFAIWLRLMNRIEFSKVKIDLYHCTGIRKLFLAAIVVCTVNSNALTCRPGVITRSSKLCKNADATESRSHRITPRHAGAVRSGDGEHVWQLREHTSVGPEQRDGVQVEAEVPMDSSLLVRFHHLHGLHQHLRL